MHLILAVTESAALTVWGAFGDGILDEAASILDHAGAVAHALHEAETEAP